jgi:hypothetical protein
MQPINQETKFHYGGPVWQKLKGTPYQKSSTVWKH